MTYTIHELSEKLHPIFRSSPIYKAVLFDVTEIRQGSPIENEINQQGVVLFERAGEV